MILHSSGVFMQRNTSIRPMRANASKAIEISSKILANHSPNSGKLVTNQIINIHLKIYLPPTWFFELQIVEIQNLYTLCDNGMSIDKVFNSKCTLKGDGNRISWKMCCCLLSKRFQTKKSHKMNNNSKIQSRTRRTTQKIANGNDGLVRYEKWDNAIPLQRFQLCHLFAAILSGFWLHGT